MKFKDKILITGAEGFISHYLIKLLKKKYKVYGSFFNKKKLIKDEEVTYYKCDVRKLSNVKSLLFKIKPKIIFHLAAKSHPTLSFQNPLLTLETNVMGTANILETVKNLKQKPKIIIACSSAQYGSRPLSKLPMVEGQVYHPEHIYGLSKVFQENLGSQYFKMFKIKIVNAIIFNTSGPRKRYDVFYDLCKQYVKQNKKKIINISCGNLNKFRDFMHVEDVATALYILAIRGKPGSSYNIGSSNLIKVSKIIQAMRNLHKKKINLITDKAKYRSFDEKYISSSNTKIKKLGWKPKKNIYDIVRDMYNFLSKKNK